MNNTLIRRSVFGFIVILSLFCYFTQERLINYLIIAGVTLFAEIVSAIIVKKQEEKR